MKGTLLRLLNGTQLSSKFLATIEQLLGPIEIEYYKTIRDSSTSYNRRRDSLFAAFLFILKAYPTCTPSLNTSYLQKYAEIAKKHCIFNKQDNIDTLQNTLKTFTTELVNALVMFWNFSKDKNHAIECLNEAEQYVLMQSKRKNLATLIPKNIKGKQHYILQWEQVISPGRASWYDELRYIQKLQTPKSPAWFYNLSKSEQEYISSYSGVSTDLKIELKKFSDFYIGLQNSREAALTYDLNSIAKGDNLPDWFINLLPRQQTYIAANLPATVEQLENILEKFYQTCPENIENLHLLPFWYTILSSMQQSFLETVLKEAEDTPLELAITWLSSRHRTLPALANARRHILLVLDENGKIVFQPQERYGSSHIVSRDALNMSNLVMKEHMQNNFQQICDLADDKQMIIIQTLISPVSFLNYAPSWITDRLPPDLALYNLLKQVIDSYKNSKNNVIVQTNHPLNQVKYVSYTVPDTQDCHSLLIMAKKATPQTSFLKSLTSAYEQLLNSKRGSATVFDKGRELFLSSLEQLLILELKGLSYGSCVSGKDRKGIEFIHTDAMLLYFFIYGKWHNYDDPIEDRNSFIEIVVDLFTSNHQQEHAGQNAPGSEGIKTPQVYWPQDIAQAIKSRLRDQAALNTEDRIASNNEVAKIGLDSSITEKLTHCKLVVVFLGEENCQKLMDVLRKFLEEKGAFKKLSWRPNLYKSSTGESFGIQEIRKLIKQPSLDKKIDENPLEIVAKILHIITTRPENNEGRTDLTIAVYNYCKDIFQAPQKIDTILADMEGFYMKILDVNRKKSCIAS